MPALAYDLIDFDAYERASGERKLPYATSVGCRYACNYCTHMVFYNRRFNAYSAEYVVSELTAPPLSGRRRILRPDHGDAVWRPRRIYQVWISLSSIRFSC